MLTLKTANGIKQTSNLQTVVLCMLIPFLLLSSCSVRKSIEAFFIGSVNTELNAGNGLKKIRATTNDVHLINHQLCTDSEKAAFEAVRLDSSKGSFSLLPLALFLVNLHGFTAFVLLTLYNSSLFTVFSKASFAVGNAPIYIKNRILLI